MHNSKNGRLFPTHDLVKTKRFIVQNNLVHSVQGLVPQHIATVLHLCAGGLLCNCTWRACSHGPLFNPDNSCKRRRCDHKKRTQRHTHSHSHTITHMHTCTHTYVHAHMHTHNAKGPIQWCTKIEMESDNQSK